MVNGVPTQGDIVMLSAEPRKGHEQRGYRPYICLSHKLISDYANIAVFAPVSNTNRRYPLYVPLEGTKTTGSVLLDQLVAIDYHAREFQFVETVSLDFLRSLLEKAVLIFQLNSTPFLPKQGE
jgi:mRNA interferase MazF